MPLCEGRLYGRDVRLAKFSDTEHEYCLQLMNDFETTVDGMGTDSDGNMNAELAKARA